MKNVMCGIKDCLNKYRTILVFLCSGGFAAAFQLLLYIFLERILQVPYLISSGIAFVAAVIVSFLLQKYVTFQNKSGDMIGKQFTYFVILSVLNLSVNTLLMYIFVDIFGVHDVLAQAFCMVSIAIWSFFIYKHVIFKHT